MYFKTDNPSSREQHQFIENLIKEMRQIDFQKLAQGIHHHKPFAAIFPKLRKDGFVWVRIDRVKKPLESSYEGPYHIINFDNKTVTIHRSGKPCNISIDRIKPTSMTIPATYSLSADEKSPVSSSHSSAASSQDPQVVPQEKLAAPKSRKRVRFCRV